MSKVLNYDIVSCAFHNKGMQVVIKIVCLTVRSENKIFLVTSHNQRDLGKVWKVIMHLL